MLSHFHLIPERYGQTNRQTDRIDISISRVSVLTREKTQEKSLEFTMNRTLMKLFELRHLMLSKSVAASLASVIQSCQNCQT